MGKYYDEKKAIKPPKPRKNNMGGKEVKNEQENEMRKRKTPKRTKEKRGLTQRCQKTTLQKFQQKTLTLILRNI